MNRLIGIARAVNTPLPNGVDAVVARGFAAYFTPEHGTKLSHHSDVIRLCGVASSILPARFLDLRSSNSLEQRLVASVGEVELALNAIEGKIEIAFSATITKAPSGAPRKTSGGGKSFLKDRARALHLASQDIRILDELKGRLTGADFPGLKMEAACNKSGFAGSILVSRAQGAKVANEIDAILTAHEAVQNFDLLGPLPPYSFFSASSILEGTA